MHIRFGNAVTDCCCLHAIGGTVHRRFKKELSGRCKLRVPAGDSDQQGFNSLVMDEQRVDAELVPREHVFDAELESIPPMIHGESADIDLFSIKLANNLTSDVDGAYYIPAS